MPVFPYRPDSDFGRSGVLAVVFVGFALLVAVMSESAATWYRDTEPFRFFEQKVNQPKNAEQSKAEPPKRIIKTIPHCMEYSDFLLSARKMDIPPYSRVFVDAKVMVRNKVRVLKLLNDVPVYCNGSTWDMWVGLAFTPKEEEILEAAQSRGYLLRVKMYPGGIYHCDPDYDIDAVVRLLDELARPVSEAP